MPETNTITLQRGDRAVLERVGSRVPNAPVQYNIRVYRGDTDSVVATMNANEPLVINGSGENASITIPQTVGISNNDPIPRLTVKTENPVLVEGGSFVVTADSTQAARTYATPVGLTSLRVPPTRGGDTIDPAFWDERDRLLRQATTRDKRLGANPTSVQLMTYRNPQGRAVTVGVAGNGEDKGGRIEFMDPAGGRNADPMFTLSGGQSLDTNRENLGTQQTRVREAVITAVKESKFDELRALGTGAGGMGGMGARPELQQGPDGERGRRPGSNTPMQEPGQRENRPQPQGPNTDRILQQQATIMDNLKNTIGANLYKNNEGFRTAFDAAQSALTELRNKPSAETQAAFDTAMDTLITNVQDIAKSPNPRVRGPATAMQRQFEGIKTKVDGADAAGTGNVPAQPAPGEQREGEGTPRPRTTDNVPRNDRPLGEVAAEQFTALEKIKNSEDPIIREMFQNNKKFIEAFNAAHTAMQTVKDTPNVRNQEAFNTAMGTLIDATAHVQEAAAGRRANDKAAKAGELVEQFRTMRDSIARSQAPDRRTPTRRENNQPEPDRRSGALPTPTEMMLASLRDSMPASLQNQPVVHVDDGTSVVSNGPGGQSGTRQIS